MKMMLHKSRGLCVKVLNTMCCLDVFFENKFQFSKTKKHTFKVIYLVICKCKRPGIARTTLKNKNKIGEHMLPGFKTYKAIVIKIVWCCTAETNSTL